MPDVIGKKKYKKISLKNIKEGEEVIKFLNKLNIPIFTVTGNNDWTHHKEIGQTVTGAFDYDKKLIKDHATTKLVSKTKNFELLDFASKKYKEFNLIGYPRSSYPGYPTKHVINKYGMNSKEIKKRINSYKQYEKRMLKVWKGKKNIIFVSHNVPYGLNKLDIIRAKKADKLAKGRHYGSILTKNLIKKKQPRLCICGHMHENPGAAKIGKTKVVNPGAALEGRYAIIRISPKTTSVKLKKA